MANSKLELPNIRRIIVPDPGYLLCDCDLAGADAQVVAWEANDEDLKNAFRQGLNVHNHNGVKVWGNAYDPQKKVRKFTMRDELKRAVHGTNYGASSATIAKTLSWSVALANEFQHTWFTLHPGILEWQRRTERDILTKRQTSNRFGYKITWFDRAESCLTKALAWTPQSTVGLVCARGGINLRRYISWAEVLLQVHDSLVFQIPFSRYSPSGLAELKKVLEVEVPYPDPLVIPWGLAVSEKSWGDVEKVNWAV